MYHDDSCITIVVVTVKCNPRFSFAKAQKVACDSSEYAYIVVLNLLFLLGSC